MKAALLIVLSLSALAYAGPAFNKNANTNQIDANKAQQQQQYMTNTGDLKQTQATEILKQWCFASQMSQPELTSSFKKLVGVVKSSPEEQSTEAAVMSERICQGALVQKSAQTGETFGQTGADAKAHELIKDVYMDALISCESRECMQQLVKIINSNKVDAIRASYYMTRIAVTEKASLKKDDAEAKQLAEDFVSQQQHLQQTSEAVERQKLFAVTSLLGKSLKGKVESKQQIGDIKSTVEQVVKTIVERYIKPVSQEEVQQYQQQQPQQQQSSQVAKKIAKRSAALKALANIPGSILKECQNVEEILLKIAQNKHELSTARQSAIECLEQNEQTLEQLKQITFDQQEPIEVRVAAYRTLMTVVFAGNMKDEQTKQQQAAEIVDQIVKHCENQRNQQEDDQFVLFAISHLDNLRTSQQPEHQAIKKCITENKQHYMQIQLLCKKLKWDIRKSSRNYKLEQEFNQIESGLIIEGDLIYESKQKQQQQQQQQLEILPKLVRVNMSMPVMGETVNVVEITLRQNNMDEELLGALKLVQGAKFNSESMSKVVDSFKSSVERSAGSTKQQQQSAEADLSIKVDGCTIVYLCLDDFKSAEQQQHKRNTRSIYGGYSIVDEIIEHLKRKPVAFNRGFNFNLNERIAKILDIDANVIAGLRFESRANGQSSKDFEIVAQMEPRFAFEAIVGPAKMSSKKLLQRFSTKTACGLRLKFKSNELVDVQIDLPMNVMELFTFESQLVEKSSKVPHSYTYLPESIYGQEDIYSPEESAFRARSRSQLLDDTEEIDTVAYVNRNKMLKKRSIFDGSSTGFSKKSIAKFMQGKQSSLAHSFETSEGVARATGLRNKLRVAVSPKEMSFFAQFLVEKYEPRMQGYRLQLQKVGHRDQEYVLTLSTPGSRVERTMQLRLVKQTSSQRTMIKSEIQSPKMSAACQLELVHDGRHYAVKLDMSSTRGQQWRHSIETGLQRASQQQSGRVATTFKPYLTIDSTYLKRPVQLQGVVSYQQSPRTVINYELKCPTSGDFVQGKWIVDQRPSSPYYGKRVGNMNRRSMQSPIELLLQNDLTWTGELVGQVREHTVKLHQMVDWMSSKFAMNADLEAHYKNERKSLESHYSANLKVDKDQQVWVSSYKCPQQPNKDYRLTLSSDCKSQNGHAFVVECRYGRNMNQVVAYKHKLDFVQVSPKKAELGLVLELVDSARQFNEKFAGRAQLGLERTMKTLKTEMSSRNKQVKLNVEFVSLQQHLIELTLQGERLAHRTSIRADQRQLAVQSRTEKQGQMLAKIVLELFKQQQQQGQCQLIVELPTKSTHLVIDLKPESGKLSSMALQTPRFASKAEFAFDTLSRAGANKFWMKPFTSANYRFKTDLKDMMNKEAYFMESAWNGELNKKSFLRLDSPIYRTDLEYEPRDSSAKLGMFARLNKNKSLFSNNNNNQYSTDESIINEPFDFAAKLATKLPSDKLWMVRSMISSPRKMEELKEKARRALFEYADRRQSQKHFVNWNPIDERVNFNFERQPIEGEPMRLTGDLSHSFGAGRRVQPSTVSLESPCANFELEAKPFDGEDSLYRINAISRQRRSASFKKHESELSYKRDQGYKAWMKHQDSQDKHHKVSFESDVSPKKWAKLAYESEKLGKGQWEHKWRKHTVAGKHNQDGAEQELFANSVAFYGESPKRGDWLHRSTFSWDEPRKMVAGERLVRRDLQSQLIGDLERANNQRYTTLDYLKHVNARLNSQTSLKNQADLYNVDFDYQPERRAHLQVSMPNELLHSSSLEFEPTERVYKLQSSLVNQRTKVPHYELLATSGKPTIAGLASAEQEPVFVDEQHSMLDRPIANRMTTGLFRQPLKLDYTDKSGRAARFDYDLSPMASTIESSHYAGLRQKRAAVYYKDEQRDFEHDATYDFYPEAVLGFKPSKRVPGDLVVKAQTKYGPVVVHAESNQSQVELVLESPVVNAKLVGETTAATGKRTAAAAQLFKFTIDNKQQRVQLAKIVRQTPILNDCQLVQKLAHKIDQGRFEHQSELLISIVERIFKIKSQTMMNGRQLMTIEGELNKPQEKAYVKIDGKRTQGELIVDLINKSANLVLDVDDKRTVHHQTRLVRVSDKFYSLESMTSYKQQPLFKLNGKVSSLIFSEPEHLFSRHQSERSAEQHVSTFEAMLYEPKPMKIEAQYDCIRKEAHMIFKDMETKRIQETRVYFDNRTDSIKIEARLSSPRGQIYTSQAKLNLTGLLNPVKCYSQPQQCQSEVFYMQNNGNWSAKFAPGQFVFVDTPYGKQNINLY